MYVLIPPIVISIAFPVPADATVVSRRRRSPSAGGQISGGLRGQNGADPEQLHWLPYRGKREPSCFSFLSLCFLCFSVPLSFSSSTQDRRHHAMTLVSEAEKLQQGGLSYPETEAFGALVCTFKSGLEDFLCRAEDCGRELQVMVSVCDFCEQVCVISARKCQVCMRYTVCSMQPVLRSVWDPNLQNKSFIVHQRVLNLCAILCCCFLNIYFLQGLQLCCCICVKEKLSCRHKVDKKEVKVSIECCFDDPDSHVMFACNYIKLRLTD